MKLFAANTPARFWRPVPGLEAGCWERAVAGAAHLLPEAVQRGLAEGGDLAELVLGEGQFGPRHWELGPARRMYYEVKPLLPARLTRHARRIQARVMPSRQRLRWPVEDRYALFLAEVARGVLAEQGVDCLPILDFWPRGARFALVLTHDVESAAGQSFAAAVADLEEGLGFRSSFNLVGGLYRLDHGLVRDLQRRGFEVGVHGLRHDGKLFSSHREFSRRARLINQRLRELGAGGFRSPLTLRNPEWMQELDLEYDLSFFDTDPFEPIPGGTMSAWPFQIGSFMELPYTLAQDHTLRFVVGERTPRLWLEKIEFLARIRGMALLNTHPDYLRDPSMLDIYRSFLGELAERPDHWHALPGQLARWWRARAAAACPEELPGAVLGRMSAPDPFRLWASTPNQAA